MNPLNPMRPHKVPLHVSDMSEQRQQAAELWNTLEGTLQAYRRGGLDPTVHLSAMAMLFEKTKGRLVELQENLASAENDGLWHPMRLSRLYKHQQCSVMTIHGPDHGLHPLETVIETGGTTFEKATTAHSLYRVLADVVTKMNDIISTSGTPVMTPTSEKSFDFDIETLMSEKELEEKPYGEELLNEKKIEEKPHGEELLDNQKIVGKQQSDKQPISKRLHEKSPFKIGSDESSGDDTSGNELTDSSSSSSGKSDDAKSHPSKTEATNRAEESVASNARDADQKRSRLLQQYNEMRDIGQQLIGLVADYRGVSIRSLYESEEFGVGPDD